MTLILLDTSQASQVRGADDPFAALQPVALTDGRFILGTEVLTDAAHSEHWPLLSGLPTCEMSDIEALLPRLEGK